MGASIPPASERSLPGASAAIARALLAGQPQTRPPPPSGAAERRRHGVHWQALEAQAPGSAAIGAGGQRGASQQLLRSTRASFRRPPDSGSGK
jgi:hypothetical protein